MVPTLFFYELVLVALVWLFLMLYWLGPLALPVAAPGGNSQAPPAPAPVRSILAQSFTASGGQSR